MKILRPLALYAVACFATNFLALSSNAQELPSSSQSVSSQQIYFASNRSITPAVGDEENRPAIPGIASFHPNMKLVINTTDFTYPANPKNELGADKLDSIQLLTFMFALKKYAIEHDLDTTRAMLADLGLKSNKKRLFIVNLSTFEVEESALVSHGRGTGSSMYSRMYSNELSSRSSSLGHYEVGAPYNGKYGFSYKLRGLDSTNSNATRRSIVMHSMSCIPDREWIMGACVSDGCPAVSKNFLNVVTEKLKLATKPLALWLVDSNLQRVELINEEDPCETETATSNMDQAGNWNDRSNGM